MDTKNQTFMGSKTATLSNKLQVSKKSRIYDYMERVCFKQIIKDKTCCQIIKFSVLTNKFSLVKNVCHNKEAGTYIDIDVSGTMREMQGDSKHTLSHSLKEIKGLTSFNLKENNKEEE